MNKLLAAFKGIHSTLIDRFGRVGEYSQFNGYWHCAEYWGPFEREYDGKFCYHAPLSQILEDAKALKPYVDRNELIGFKHRTGENQLDDPHHGEQPRMIVYSALSERERVLEILKSIGVENPEWLEEDYRISHLEEALVSRDMLMQNVSNPYSV